MDDTDKKNGVQGVVLELALEELVPVTKVERATLQTVSAKLTTVAVEVGEIRDDMRLMRQEMHAIRGMADDMGAIKDMVFDLLTRVKDRP